MLQEGDESAAAVEYVFRTAGAKMTGSCSEFAVRRYDPSHEMDLLY